jgi:hypothetical protein
MSPNTGQKIGRVQRHLGLGHGRSGHPSSAGVKLGQGGGRTKFLGEIFPRWVVFALFQNVWASCKDSLADSGRLRAIGGGRGGVSWPRLADGRHVWQERAVASDHRPAKAAARQLKTVLGRGRAPRRRRFGAPRTRPPRRGFCIRRRGGTAPRRSEHTGTAAERWARKAHACGWPRLCAVRPCAVGWPRLCAVRPARSALFDQCYRAASTVQYSAQRHCMHCSGCVTDGSRGHCCGSEGVVLHLMWLRL